MEVEKQQPSVPPRLSRAVVHSIQGFGARQDSINVLQNYLSDASTVDAAYLELIRRGRAEPNSPLLLANCFGMLISSLSHFTPSGTVLQEIANFIGEAPQRLQLVFASHAMRFPWTCAAFFCVCDIHGLWNMPASAPVASAFIPP